MSLIWFDLRLWNESNARIGIPELQTSQGLRPRSFTLRVFWWLCATSNRGYYHFFLKSHVSFSLMKSGGMSVFLWKMWGCKTKAVINGEWLLVAHIRYIILWKSVRVEYRIKSNSLWQKSIISIASVLKNWRVMTK